MRSLLLAALSVLLMASGAVLVAYFALGFSTRYTAQDGAGAGSFDVPVLESAVDARSTSVEGPEDKTLKVTVPEMARVKNAVVPDAAGDDQEALRNNVAIHLKGTGFPWQEGANTYLAGHRLGYPNTDSFLAFWDLDALERGDEVFVEDADGNEYRYEVFREAVVEPTNLEVTRPVPGKDVLTLQSCTLPDYSQRLIVQAEKVG
ncbi:sortase (plasmid) [Rubrobacter marinus]|uniref:Sortase n=1 Tax=Rubrobacter marinus TaxID=2653852 RepID=A0A6G8Q3D6_9ACTN|nr:class E sortase [Rubrobacter marinus]QIN80982.1 sortase [Rubrobacter marinus]